MPTTSAPEKTIAQIVRFDDRYQNAFVSLNFEWIQKYFVVERHDLEQLNNPRQNILDRGGEIFFVIENDQVVGTCAMVPVENNGQLGYELAKMAVSPNCRGRGYGDLLIKTAIDWARSKDAGYVMLLSNTVLEPAIKLYKKHGFAVERLGPHPDYERCNIEMTLRFA